MNVLFLTRYSSLGASSRYRILQYLPYLRENGFVCAIQSLFDDKYLENLYQGQRSKLAILSAFYKRCLVLREQINFNIIFLEKELLPYVPIFFEDLLCKMKIPYIVDYDDALFHQYDCHKNIFIHQLLKNKISDVMRRSAYVVAGNNYLAEYANRTGAANVEVIPTVVDLSRYTVKEYDLKNKQENFVIGWIGSPSTTGYVEQVIPVLKEICKDGRSNLRLIGAGPVNLADMPFESIPWSESTEIKWLKSFDVGIMPLPDTPWARGKCGFKLIQYMACGLPVVASPVGVNKEIVEHGINGFLAETDDEWMQALSILKDNPDLIKRMGAAGRHKVEKKYSLQVTAPRLINLLKSLIDSQETAN